MSSPHHVLMELIPSGMRITISDDATGENRWIELGSEDCAAAMAQMDKAIVAGMGI